MRLFLLFFPLLGLWSCNEVEDRGMKDEVPFAFEIAVNPNTKSDAAIQMPGICHVWVYEGDSAVIEGEKLVRNGSLWYPEGRQNWPIDSEVLDFYAACPSERAVFNLDGGVQFRDYSLDEDLQPLYAGPFSADNAHSSAGVVPLVFSHALALVRFNFSAMLREGSSLTESFVHKTLHYCRQNDEPNLLVFWILRNCKQKNNKTGFIYTGNICLQDTSAPTTRCVRDIRVD